SRNVGFYVNIVAKYSLKRTLIQTAEEIASEGFSDETDVEDLLTEAEGKIMSISESRRNEGFKSMKSVVHEVYEQVRSEEHTSELQSRFDLVCRLLLEKKKTVA